MLQNPHRASILVQKFNARVFSRNTVDVSTSGSGISPVVTAGVIGTSSGEEERLESSVYSGLKMWGGIFPHISATEIVLLSFNTVF